ncbi:hypothetical protein SEVIR_4G258500v4 [Setaria viridis]|uniref:Uncharacterized protein n=2 Tax=Setaria TaxID=4554 RepID=A0A368QXU2_SETIT|nr:hypothetical protein SETIT_4G246000v2 [Setaria italica]TKW22902.1 hypothetical protein SEVIR_4G258500v2 [Setaria viridis]
MRRRRWARAAGAVCLAVVVVLQLVAAGEGRRPLLPPERARGHAHAHSGKGLPPPTGSTSSSLPVHHDVATAGASVSFNAAGARCKSNGRKAGGAAGIPAAAGGAACAEDDDDDKRRIPTGPNPLHNR